MQLKQAEPPVSEPVVLLQGRLRAGSPSHLKKPEDVVDRNLRKLRFQISLQLAIILHSQVGSPGNVLQSSVV